MNFPVFISKYIEEALTKAGFASVDALSQIKVSADSKFGDYQFNGSMGLAKEAKVSPRKVAEKIVEARGAPETPKADVEAKLGSGGGGCSRDGSCS